MTPSSKLSRISIAALALALLATLLCRPGFVPALSSDSLYIDDLWQSLFDGRGLGAWHLPPGPSYFPDLILYGISTLLADDLGLRHACYAFFQLLLLAGGTALVCRRRLGLELSRAWLTALTGLALFVALMANQGGLNLLFVPTHHGGAMAAALWIFGLSAASGKRHHAWELALWWLATALLALSDTLALAWGVVPALLLGWRERADRRWMGALIAGVVAAKFFGHYWHGWGGPQTAQFKWSYYFANAPGLLLGGFKTAQEMLLREPWAALVALAWFGYFIRKAEPSLALFSALSVVFSLALIPLTGNISERYFYPLFYFPAAFLVESLPQRFRNALAGMVMAVILALTCRSVLASSFSPQTLKAPHPPELEQLEASLENPSQVSGFADYWVARRLRMLSTRGLWLDAVETRGPEAGNFFLSDWMRNARTRMTPHTFVVMNGLIPESIEGFFGKPKKRLKFDNLEVWYYEVGMDEPDAQKRKLHERK